MNFYIPGLHIALSLCTPAVWQLWLNEYVMVSMAAVSEGPDQCHEAGWLGCTASRWLPDDIGSLAPGVGEGSPGPGESQCSQAQPSPVRYYSAPDRGKKGKGSPYSVTERRVPELIPVLDSQPAGDVNHKPGARLPLLSARPAVTPATLKEGCYQFCCLVNRGTMGVNSLPKTVTRRCCDCDLNPGPSAPESSMLTTRLRR